ncbi:hypothetical protein [Chelativorans alearense]|uniref:hypothetical protein n=1 Tax=Chelativorans alearense TaxID=2681495 RepID=UPI0013D456E3|nr:hypothetical protein [Chelativorans alearense]
MTTTTDRTTSTTDTTESARPYRGRRITWEEFYALRPDLRPANDNSHTLAETARQASPRQ